MKAFIVLALCLGSVLSSHVCNECQTTVQRFQDATKNPSKMPILKQMLTRLCPETKYAQECRVIVSRLEVFVRYMGTPESVCNSLNMCSNSHIDGINHIAVLFGKKFMNVIDGAKGSVCNDCLAASGDVLKVFDGHTQAKIHNFLSNGLCANLKAYQATCDNILDEILPAVFHELQAMLTNNKQFCTDLRLCTPQQANLHRVTANEVKSKIMGPKYVQNLMHSLQSVKMPEPHQMDSMSCGECQIMADMFLDQLKTTSNQLLISGVLQWGLCGFLLPKQFGCDNFIETYGPTVVYMTLMQVDSESVCEMLKMCSNDTQTTSYQLAKADYAKQKCSNCKTLSNFFETEMAKPKAKTEIVYGLQHMICANAPQSLHKLCESFMGGLLPDSYDKFLHHLNDQAVCNMIHAC